ncbi:MAG TPA: hypothetical protein PLS49_03225, partial [Candidatus Woesebacteria bacterium]|nr:hypothetical protein [Candidatus Woesebacteria bacterium]
SHCRDEKYRQEASQGELKSPIKSHGAWRVWSYTLALSLKRIIDSETSHKVAPSGFRITIVILREGNFQAL